MIMIIIIIITTRKLSDRKDDRAMRPICGYPETFRESLTTPTLLFPKFLIGFYSDGCCEYEYKI